MNKRNILFSILFLSLVFMVFPYALLWKSKELRLHIEFRNKHKLAPLTLSNLRNGSYQKQFELTLADNFPKRNDMLKADILINYNLHKITALNKQAYTLINLKNDVYTFPKHEGTLLTFILFQYDQLKQGIDRYLKYYNPLVDENPDLDFYFLKPWALNEMPFFDRDNNFKNQGLALNSYFQQQLHNRVNFINNDVASLADFHKYYYLTDNHYNELGAYQAYVKLMDVLNMKALKPKSVQKLSDLAFCGNLGRKSACLTTKDVYRYLDFDLVNYDTYVNGIQKSYGNMKHYLNPDRDKTNDLYVYGEFRGNDERHVLFDTKRTNLDNALIISDSYGNPIKYLIAQHFNQTHVVDVRLYRDFNFNDYVKKHNIKKVIHILFYGSIYSNKDVLHDYIRR